jgi:enamine deaminase RidA (YjgF/YER057c/UK114 family)
MPGPPPASTAIQVRALALPGMMIEIEAVAVL